MESIQPRPPRPCEVGRPKGRRRKNRRQSHKFLLAPAAPIEAMIEAMTEAMIDVEINAVIDPWPPFTFCRPQAIVDQDAEVSIPNSSPFSRSTRFPVHVPLRRPRPLRFERLPVPVWNPYSRGRLSPAKSEDRKGGEGKTDANLTHFFKHLLRLAPQLAATPWGGLPTPPPPPENLLLRLHRKLPSAPPASTQEVSESENRQQLGAQPTPRFRWRFR